MIWTQAAVVGAAYLLGTVSFARLVAGWRIPGEDISRTEFEVQGASGTWVYKGVSAASLIGRTGARWALLVIALDALKALIPTALARQIWPDSHVYLLVALAIIVGHIWPVFHRFRGGRGQSSMLGALLIIEPLAIPFAVVLGAVVGLLAFTSVYMARNGSPFYLPLWFLISGGTGPEIAFSFGFVVVYLMASYPDMREEKRIQESRGFASLRWSARLKGSIRDFFDTDYK